MTDQNPYEPPTDVEPEPDEPETSLSGGPSLLTDMLSATAIGAVIFVPVTATVQWVMGRAM
jgi:hypothetical protein